MGVNHVETYNARALSNAIQLRIGGQMFTGWQSASITRSIEKIAGQFELGIVKPVGVDLGQLSPGHALVLMINGQNVITGWLDEFSADVSDKDFTLKITGRDKTGDLVDCAAIRKGGAWSGRSLASIAADLCQPFGISVRWDVTDANAAKPFGTFKLEHSETVYEALGRAARQRGVLMTSNANGELVFTQAGTASAGNLELGQTLLSLNYNNNWQDRFSLYRVCGHHHGGGDLGDSMSVDQVAGPQADVIDPAVTRYRPTLKIADHNVTQQTAWARADHERRHAIAKSTRVTATVPGWYRADGQLWDVNSVVSVTAAAIGINALPLLIVVVEYSLSDNDGLTAQLTLAPREGYIVPVESENTGKNYSDSELDKKADAFLKEK